jgi:hypothetical protein
MLLVKRKLVQRQIRGGGLLPWKSTSRIKYNVYSLVRQFTLVILIAPRRLKGRTRALMNSIILFACCQGLLLYCAGWTVYQTVPHTTEGWQDYQALFANRTFVQLALSLAVCPIPYSIHTIHYPLSSPVSHLFHPLYDHPPTLQTLQTLSRR